MSLVVASGYNFGEDTDTIVTDGVRIRFSVWKKQAYSTGSFIIETTWADIGQWALGYSTTMIVPGM
jgi:hypothetical protein